MTDATRIKDLEQALEKLLEEARGMDMQIHGEWGTGSYKPDPCLEEAQKVLDAQ